MAIVLGKVQHAEDILGRDSMDRFLAWQSNASTLYGLNAVYNKPTLATAATTTKVATTTAANYAVGGNLFNLAVTGNFWTLGVAGSLTTVQANSFQKYFFLVSDTGVAFVQEATQTTGPSASFVTFGNIAAAAGANPKNPYAPLVAMLSGSQAIFGYAIVQTGAGTFVPGTTAIQTAGAVTMTFIDGIDPLLQPLIYNDRGLLLGLQI